MESRTRDDDLVGEGFAVWLQRLQGELRGTAIRLTKNGPDAADLLQATCLRALEKRHLFVQGSVADLRNWLIKIMRNLYLDGLRRRASEVPIDWLEDLAAPEPAPLPHWKTLDDRALWAAIRRLSPALREVYGLMAIDRLPYQAISSRLRISMTTVATRVHRARAFLRKRLTAHGPTRPSGRRPPPRPVSPPV